VAKATIEDAFVHLIERLTPTPDYLRYVRAVALDVWQARRSSERQHRTDMQGALTRLEGQLQQLDQAYIYDRRIDKDTYDRQRDDLRERRTLLEMTLGDVLISERDLESLLDFAEHAFAHASAIWTSAASTDERMRIQATLFPEGLVWTPAPPRFG